MATTVIDKDFIDAVATEIACGVDAAVEPLESQILTRC